MGSGSDFVLPPSQRIVPLSLTSSVSGLPCPVRLSVNRAGEWTLRPQPAIAAAAPTAAQSAANTRPTLRKRPTRRLRRGARVLCPAQRGKRPTRLPLAAGWVVFGFLLTVPATTETLVIIPTCSVPGA